MSMRGGNLQQMGDLSQRFNADADLVTDLESRITSVLSGTEWTGPAADRFRSDWDRQFRPALQKLTMALRENATIVQRRQEAIDTATT